MKRLFSFGLALLCMVGSACAATASTPEEARLAAIRMLGEEYPDEEAVSSASDGRTALLVTRDGDSAVRVRLAETEDSGAYGLTLCNEALLSEDERTRLGLAELDRTDVQCGSDNQLLLTAEFDGKTTITWAMRQDMSGAWEVYDMSRQEKNGVQTLVYHAQLVDGQIEAERLQYKGYMLTLNESYPPLPLNMDNSFENARPDVLYPYD